MADTAKRECVEDWLVRLGLRCAPTRGMENNAVRLMEYIPGLAADLPERAFCEASLEAASQKFEFFPAYAALRKMLDKWLDDNKPRLLILPGVPEDMPAVDRSMVSFWNAYRAGTKPLPPKVTLEVWLGIIRKPAPAAFAYLVRTDFVAREAATRHGWIGGRDEASAVPVQQAVGGVGVALAGVLRPVVPPVDVSGVPVVAAVIGDDGFVAAFREKHGRAPGVLSAEHLADQRKAAGINIPVPPPVAPAAPAAPPPENPFPWSGDDA